mgnify:CR=1 FL=1
MVGLHTRNNKDIDILLDTDKNKGIKDALYHRTNLFKGFANTSKRLHLRDDAHELRNLDEFVKERTDFERLCSNHTIDQYQKHVENMKRKFPRLQSCEIKSSKHTEVRF